MKTVVFEKKYGVKIEDFKDMVEIEKFIEEKEGIKLKVKSLDPEFTWVVLEDTI